MIAPGLAPWAMQEYRPLGAHCPTAPINSTNNPSPQPIQSQSNKYKNTNARNNPLTRPNTFNEHNTTTQLRKRPIRQRALQGRHSCKAQGVIRAKPDMKPWVHTDKSRLSSVGAALTHASKCPKGTIRSHAIYLSLPRIRNKRYHIMRRSHNTAFASLLRHFASVTTHN